MERSEVSAPGRDIPAKDCRVPAGLATGSDRASYAALSGGSPRAAGVSRGRAAGPRVSHVSSAAGGRWPSEGGAPVAAHGSWPHAQTNMLRLRLQTQSELRRRRRRGTGHGGLSGTRSGSLGGRPAQLTHRTAPARMGRDYSVHGVGRGW